MLRLDGYAVGHLDVIDALQYGEPMSDTLYPHIP